MGSFLPSGGKVRKGVPRGVARTAVRLATPILAFPLDREKEKDVALHILVCFPYSSHSH